MIYHHHYAYIKDIITRYSIMQGKAYVSLVIAGNLQLCICVILTNSIVFIVIWVILCMI